ncbi:MAG: helix-hairpin-helix domain-containing protein [Oscillospiraceae bacterium]|nr:helix-hairpin-helix domain-containing protein [Oscillospiraceae bacterium]
MGKNGQDNRASSGFEAVDLNVNSREESELLKLREKIYLLVILMLSLLAIIGMFAMRNSSSDSFSLLLADETELYDLSIINSATVEDFMEVDGIGEVRATSIVNFRESIGGFTDISQIAYIDGISDSTLESIIEYFYGEDSGD